MQELHGQCNAPLLLLHGGAGSMDPKGKNAKKATDALIAIAKAHKTALSRLDAILIAQKCLASLEADPLFNAGRGAALQGDGQARLTSALMCGKKQSFSGVMLATSMLHPSALALALQSSTSRVLGPPGIDLLARELGVKPVSPVTPERADGWAKVAREKGAVLGKRSQKLYDTVGAVVLTSKGLTAAGTSTGGRGFEYPGRISDSATVAGNYASKVAAISCTGIGEEIVDDAVSARIETRCRDGLSLSRAAAKTLSEALARKRQYGWIALDHNGAWSVAYTTKNMTFVVMDGRGKILAHS